jgi:hypothetical protein
LSGKGTGLRGRLIKSLHISAFYLHGFKKQGCFGRHSCLGVFLGKACLAPRGGAPQARPLEQPHLLRHRHHLLLGNLVDAEPVYGVGSCAVVLDHDAIMLEHGRALYVSRVVVNSGIGTRTLTTRNWGQTAAKHPKNGQLPTWHSENVTANAASMKKVQVRNIGLCDQSAGNARLFERQWRSGTCRQSVSCLVYVLYHPCTVYLRTAQ